MRDWSSDERAWMSRLVTRCFGIVTRCGDDDRLRKTRRKRIVAPPQDQKWRKFPKSISAQMAIYSNTLEEFLLLF